jgi:neutral ceramidase
MSLRAGVAVRDISPRKPMFLIGYPHVPRISIGIHDPLLVSALCLANGETALLLISVDVLFISRESTETCRTAIARACGMPASNILIGATHTHSGPVTATMLAWRDDPVVPAPDAEYMEIFHAGIVQAATAAWQAARPAQLAVTTARVEGVGCNRLAPDGAFDSEAGLLAVRSEGKLVALTLVYGMHPTVLHEDSRWVSSDFPYYARQQLSEAFPGLTTVYHNAPCGNLSPRYHVRSQTFAEAERLGRKLGSSVAAALGRLREEDFQADIPLAALQGYAELVPNHFSTVEEAQRALREAQQHFEQLKREGSSHGPVRTAECVVFGCEEGLTLAKAQAAGETARLQERYRQAEVQAFRIGDTLVIGLPGEQFVEYALQLKRAAPARTFVLSLANGELQGYIITPEARNQLSYEAAFALFGAESGQRLIDTALGRLTKLWK